MWLRYVVSHLVQQAAQEALVKPSVESQANPPPCEIVFLFALNAEGGALADLLESQVYTKYASYVERSGLLDGRRVVVAESGVGSAAAEQATRDCVKLHAPKWVVSAGFAGGLHETMRKGHLLMAEEIVSENGGETIHLGLKWEETSKGLHTGRLVTVDRLITSPEEKRALHERTGAAACDMETFAVAQTCREMGVRFLSVRIVSDAVDDRLPREIERMLFEKSTLGKIGAALGAVFNRFSAAGDLWRLYEDALKASQRLAKFLRSVTPNLP